MLLGGVLGVTQHTHAATFVVTTTSASGPGSLPDALSQANENCAAGPHTVVFDIASDDGGFQTAGGDAWWQIDLPTFQGLTLECDGMVLDGSTQTAMHGDTNTFQYGGGIVGFDKIPVEPVNAPEISVRNGGIVVNGAGAAVIGINMGFLRLNGAGSAAFDNTVGVEPFAWTPLPSALTSNSAIIFGDTANDALLEHNVANNHSSANNLISFNNADNVQIRRNFARCSMNNPWDLIWLVGGSVIVEENRLEMDQGEIGVECANGSSCTLINNDVLGDDYGIRVSGSGSSGFIQKNTFTAGTNTAVICGANTKCTLSQNLFVGNGGIAIDLSGQSTQGDGITVNDGIPQTCGYTSGVAAQGIDSPEILDASVVGGGNATVAGEACPDSIVELYLAIPDAADCIGGDVSGECYGEGAVYLGETVTEVDGSFFWSGTGVSIGAAITATVTDFNGNTSEFGRNFVLPSCGNDDDCISGNECMQATCNAGICEFNPFPPGTTCSTGECDGDVVDPACVPSGACLDDNPGTDLADIDSGCTVDQPFCQQGSCVSCVVSSNCKSGDICDPSGICIPGCLIDDDCFIPAECVSGVCNAGLCDAVSDAFGTPCTGGTCDGFGVCDQATGPTVNDDAFETAEDTPITFDVTANDFDPAGGTLEPTGFPSPPLNGTAEINGDFTITYTPAQDYNGSDVFEVTVCDEAGGCVDQSVTITITPVNDPPTAVDDVAVTDEGVPVIIDILFNDFDVDGEDPTFDQFLLLPGNGQVSLEPDGTVLYTPDPGYSGPDSFEYSICDLSECNFALVSITVLSAQFLCDDADSDGVAAVGGADTDCLVQGVFDSDDSDSFVCADTDNDGCDDCASGIFDPANDGPDFDQDGECDPVPACVDNDSDGVGDGTDGNIGCLIPDVDSNDNDPFVCADVDLDTCDDCASGTFDPFSDGPDTNQDGICDAAPACVDNDSDGVGDGTNGNAGCLTPDVDSNDNDPFVCTDVDLDTCDDCTSGIFDPFADGPDTNQDGICDAVIPTCVDNDNDGVGDGTDGNIGCLIPDVDSDDADAFVCADVDLDTCDDCSSGFFDPFDDGVDTDQDGLCDAAPACPDGDGDGVGDGTNGNLGCLTAEVDSDDTDATVCADVDLDTCDDCSSGIFDPFADGPDADQDGICDGVPPCVDADGDGVGDGTDGNLGCLIVDVDLDDTDAFVCADVDLDTCDDCSSGFFDPLDDGPDADQDGICDAAPVCVDGDGDGVGDGTDGNLGCIVPDIDSDDTDATACLDTDLDGCDDCSSGFFEPFDDGTDVDMDGICDASDDCVDADEDLLGDGTNGNTGCVDPTVDSDPNDPNVCADVDNDTCDDCVGGSFAPGLVPCNPVTSDGDGDGIADDQDNCAGVANQDQADLDNDDIGDACDDDIDGDGASNDAEAGAGSDPRNPDSDGDGLGDGTEIDGNTDPTNPDSDGDGLNDSEEFANNTDPNNADSDGGGLTDAEEIAYGLDPTTSADDWSTSKVRGGGLDTACAASDHQTVPTGALVLLALLALAVIRRKA